MPSATKVFACRWTGSGRIFAHKIRNHRSEAMRRSPQWQWHLDEVFVKIRGERHYFWRAVDHEGEVLESYVTKKRDKAAALKFLKKAMKRYGNPHVVVNGQVPLLLGGDESDRERGAPGNGPASQ